MIGILCSPKKEKFYTEVLHTHLRPFIKEEEISILVFSLTNTNLLEKTVVGTLISEEEITPTKASLPPLIYNFTVKHTKSNVKKFKALMDIENITLINSVNRYNQGAIMEMLLSNSKTKKYVLPFHYLKNKHPFSNFSTIGNFVIEPLKGSKNPKVIYSKQNDFGFELFTSTGKKHYDKTDMQNAISPIVQKAEFILLRTPKLLTYKNKLFILRAYMQKNAQNQWEIILKMMLPQNERFGKRLDKKLGSALMKTVHTISCFIKDLNFCFIDLVLSQNGDPYFLNFGGWDSILLSENQSLDVKTDFSKNLAKYAKSFLKSEEKALCGLKLK